MKLAKMLRWYPVAALTVSTFLLPSPAVSMPGPNLMGSGLALTDYDRDGDLDILHLTTRDGRVKVFSNDGDGMTYTNVTATAMAGITFNANGMGFATGDINNDGYDDFFVTFGPYPPLTMETPYRLFMNNTQGGFYEVTQEAGLLSYETGVLSSSSVFFDYDEDGDLDLYVGNYLKMVPKQTGDVDLVNAKKHFYENTGLNNNGVPVFVDRTDDMGLGWTGGKSEWTLGLATGDYDNDGDQDLYVANDYGGYDPGLLIRDGDDALFRNNGPGVPFTNVMEGAGWREHGYSMGVDFGDFDNDGDLDAFLANFWEDALLRNRGDGTFENAAVDLGIVENLNGWGAGFRDFDNDGDLDILNVNGWIQNSWGQVECEGNAIWENLGQAGFVNRIEGSGMQDYGDARGAGFGDVNRDGWVDVVIVNNTDFDHATCEYKGGGLLLLINQKNGTFQDISKSAGLRGAGADLPPATAKAPLDNNWITFDLAGTTCNRSCIGARVTIQIGNNRQMRELGAGSYMSAGERSVHFGVGKATVIDRVTVRWPGREDLTEVVENVTVNQRMTLTEGAVPVQLVSFVAEAEGSGARIRWEFTDATDHAGFRIHRREEGSGAFVSLVDRLITTEGTTGTYLDEKLAAGWRYEYRLEAVSRSGESQWFGPIAFSAAPPVAARLGQNYPNPFNPTTTIPVTLKSGGRAVISVFGPDGRLVRTLDVTGEAGDHIVVWDGRDQAGAEVPSGVYLYQMDGESAGGLRMTLVK